MTNGINKPLNLKVSSNMAFTGATEDTVFCPNEDYYEDLHSPTDTSEDSLEVKVCAIQPKHKRKCSEPRKVPEMSSSTTTNSTVTFTGPLKKRMCLQLKASAGAPFRPWSPKPKFIAPTPESSYFRPPSPIKFYQQTEAVALVKKREEVEEAPPRVPIHPPVALSPMEAEQIILSSADSFPSLQDSSKKSESGRREQRNYKNMTRERRIEANARERTRVHTISAAFDTLRKSIPAYSNVQKLSKLSVLRIACSYIMTLSSIVNNDEDSSTGLTTAECVDLVTSTIQREGKLRKKKDDND